MIRVSIASHVAAAGLIACLAAAPPAGAATVLAPHLAIYDLKLVKSQGKRPVEAVRGRILYDFSGSPCEGYALNFRQVSELDSGAGKVATSDLRATTWEDAKARKFRFNSENQFDQRTEKVDGQAERKTAAVSVNLSKPKE